jgi:prepilin-type N-terminal cleavage/methylation domain-containing protein
MLTLGSIRKRLSDEQGFTLIEMLVAMVAGVAVTGALFSILDVALHQTSRMTDKVQVDQNGRIAMTKIVDELHSSCLSYGFVPIQSGSSGSTLAFVNAYSKESVIPSATKHEIIWSSSAETLTDKSYASTGGSWPSFTFSGTATPVNGVRIANNISQGVEAGKTVPIFRYYAYAQSAESTSETPLGAIKSTAMTETELAKSTATVSSVKIVFTQAPSDGYPATSGQSRNAQFTSQSTLAFSVPNSEVPIHDAPCQ